jgi:phosphoglycolate phosphatase
VLTNKDQEFANNCVNHFFPQGTFQCVQGFDQHVPHKPNPTGALTVAKTLNVKPENMVLIGDTAVDINTANSANFVSIGALWGFRDRVELVSAGADHIVTTPSDVLNVVFT